MFKMPEFDALTADTKAMPSKKTRMGKFKALTRLWRSTERRLFIFTSVAKEGD